MSFLSKLLGVVSGNSGLKMSDQLLFDKVIGFRGVVPGVGTSTIVQNTAIALSEKSNYSICVLDTNFLYPTQYPMLLNAPEGKRKDYLDFSGDVSEVTLPTTYRNVHLLSLSQRTIVDMMSSRDSDLTVDKLIGALKSYFDIILVDLSTEVTNITAHSAIKCNKIINIADQSLKSVYYLRKSLNTMATLAVPLAKADRVVLNKIIPDVLSNTRGVAEDAGLKVIGEIPISLEIAKQGVAGKRIWATTATNKDLYAFSEVINNIIDEVIQTTPLNQKYTEPKAVESRKKDNKDNTPDLIDQEIGEDLVNPEIEFKTTSEEALTGQAKPKAQPKPPSKPKPVPQKKPEPVQKQEEKENKSKPVQQAKPEPKPEPKPVAQPKPKPKPVAKSEPKPVAKPKPETQLVVKPEPKPVAKPKPIKTEVKPVPKPIQQAEPKEQEKSVQQAEPVEVKPQESKPTPKPKPIEKVEEPKKRVEDTIPSVESEGETPNAKGVEDAPKQKPSLKLKPTEKEVQKEEPEEETPHAKGVEDAPKQKPSLKLKPTEKEEPETKPKPQPPKEEEKVEETDIIEDDIIEQDDIIGEIIE